MQRNLKIRSCLHAGSGWQTSFVCLKNVSIFFQLVVKQIFLKKKLYKKLVSLCHWKILNHCMAIIWNCLVAACFRCAGSQNPCTHSHLLTLVVTTQYTCTVVLVLFFNFQLYWGTINKWNCKIFQVYIVVSWLLYIYKHCERIPPSVN